MSWFMRLIGSSNTGEVDSQGQQRTIPYDASGNSLAPINRAAISETIGGIMLSSKDYKLARTIRSGSTGALAISGDETIRIYDAFEGTTRNPNIWIETATTQASAQTLATGLQLNSGTTTTTTTGILESSHQLFPLIPRSGLLFRARVRYQGATNCQEEWGFSDQSSATTALHNNGAFFRRDSAGSVQAVLAFNGTEKQSSTFTSPPATTDYAWYEIWLEDDRATFSIFTVSGVLIGAIVMERGASTGSGDGTQARMLAATHIAAMFRTVNSGTAGTAPSLWVTAVLVLQLDVNSQRSLQVQQSGMGFNSLQSPTAYTQAANWSNSAAPTTRTLSNTAAAETTLGGLLRVNSIAGGNTDLIMFAWTNPSPYTFYVDSINIPVPMNEVVAVATTATIFAYFAAFNCSADSLATGGQYPPLRIALPGIHTAAVGLAANALFTGNNVQITFPTPIAVMPSRRVHICCRELVGTATATETYLWAGVSVGGFFD